MGILVMGDVVKGSKEAFVSTSLLPLCEEEREVINVEVLSYELARLQRINDYLTLPYDT